MVLLFLILVLVFCGHGGYACGCGYVCELMVLLLMSMAVAMMVLFSVLWFWSYLLWCWSLCLYCASCLSVAILLALLLVSFISVSDLTNAQAQDHRTSSYGLHWIQNQNWSINWWIKHFDHHKPFSLFLVVCRLEKKSKKWRWDEDVKNEMA